MAALAAGLAALSVLRAESTRIDFSARIEDALIVVLGFLAFRALYLWLRPIVGAPLRRPGGAARRRRSSSHAHGEDSLAFFSLRRDKSYFFSPSGRSFLAYRVVGGCALVSGDPIGAADELGELVDEFRRVARARAWRLAFLGVGEALLPLYRSRGFRSLYLGDEAIVRPRAVLARGPRDPQGAPVRHPRSSGPATAPACSPRTSSTTTSAMELARVSDEWRGRWPERGFTMAMDSSSARRGHLRDRRGRAGPRRRLHPARAVARERRVLARDDAPPPATRRTG